MTQTLQEILAKNNIKTSSQTTVSQQTTVSAQKQEDNSFQQEQKAYNSSNVSQTQQTTSSYQQEQKATANEILMSSDDTENLDIKKFEGTVSSSNYFHLEEDIYEAKCTKIERIMGKNFDGMPEEKFCWHFQIENDSTGEKLVQPVKLKYYTRLAFGDKSNNYKVYSTFFGSTPEKYNILECIGKDCRVNVIDHKAQNGNTYSKIKDILKAKKK